MLYFDFDFRYLGSGCNQLDLHLTYRIGHTTVGRILRKVCKVIWDTIREESFPQFTETRWKEIAERFQETCHFPNCLGAIDGKHVRIRKPKLSGSLFHNYKNYFSVVLLAVADADYKFIYIDVGAFGKDSDSTIFQKSDFYKKLANDELKIPKSQPLPGTDGPRMPYTFVADEAFALSEHVMRPYSGKILSEKKRVFNYRLSRARRNVESAFGILSNKWSIFHKAINVDLPFAITLIKTCCALHNFVRSRDGVQFQDILSVQGIVDVDQDTTPPARPPLQSTQRRNMLADYFVSEAGSVPWQHKYI